MLTFLTVTAIIFTVAFLGTVGMMRVIIIIAQKDVWWSPFRIAPAEGTFFATMKAGPQGAADSVFESVPKYELDNNFEFIGPTTVTAGEDSFLRNVLGVVWVGFNKSQFKRPIEYDTYARDEKGNWKISNAERDSTNIFFLHLIGVEREVLAAGNFPVKVGVLVTVEIHRPIQAIFVVGAWERDLTAAIDQTLREYVGQRDVNTLRAEFDQNGPHDLVDRLIDLTNFVGGKPGTFETIGLKITKAQFVLFDFESANEAITAALQRQQIADLNLSAAQKEADARAKLGEGEAKRLQQILAAGEGAGSLAGVEALANALSNTKASVVSLGGNIPVTVNTDKKNP